MDKLLQSWYSETLHKNDKVIASENHAQGDANFPVSEKGLLLLGASDGILQVSISDCKFFEIFKWKIK